MAIALALAGCGARPAKESTVTNAAPAPSAETRTDHAALTQFYRWYVLYERPITPERVEHQLEILAPDVQIDGARGKGTGHAAYREVVAALPTAERHAHHIQRTKITRRDATTTDLEADIVYHMSGPDKSVVSHALHYTTTLRDEPGRLPVFTSITIKPTGPGNATAFADAYAHNRATSFLHYWLWRIEDVTGSAEPFRELLAEDGLALEFSTSGTPLTSFDQFAAWHAKTTAMVKQSSHVPENVKIEPRGDGVHLAADFRWRGVTADGKAMAALTHHEWDLIDRGERFPRLRRAKVVQVEPFRPVE